MTYVSQSRKLLRLFFTILLVVDLCGIGMAAFSNDDPQHIRQGVWLILSVISVVGYVMLLWVQTFSDTPIPGASAVIGPNYLVSLSAAFALFVAISLASCAWWPVTMGLVYGYQLCLAEFEGYLYLLLYDLFILRRITR